MMFKRFVQKFRCAMGRHRYIPEWDRETRRIRGKGTVHLYQHTCVACGEQTHWMPKKEQLIFLEDNSHDWRNARYRK